MIRSIGIDPGTKSFDICGIEEEKGEIKVFLEESIPSEILAKEPELIVEMIKKNEPIDSIVAPSGYGITLKNIREITEEDKKLVILVKEIDPGIPVLKGLPKLLKLFSKLNMNIYMIPGIIQLHTIPYHRKINKIDMGTADKLCINALAIYDQSKELGISYDETNFILIEMGYAYNALSAVKNGKIIDGIGGTNSIISFKSMGGLDGEVAYLLGGFKKEILFKGGISDLIKSEEPAKMFENEIAREAFFEGIEKMVAILLVSLGYPKEILISGRLSNNELIFNETKKRLRKYSKVRKIKGISNKVKEAAQGAAIIANGLANGKFKTIVDVLELKNCKDSVIDFVNVLEKKEVMKRLKSIEINL